MNRVYSADVLSVNPMSEQKTRHTLITLSPALSLVFRFRSYSKVVLPPSSFALFSIQSCCSSNLGKTQSSVMQSCASVKKRRKRTTTRNNSSQEALQQLLSRILSSGIKQTVVLSVSAKFVLFANKKYLHVIMSAGVLNFNFNFRTILYNIIMHTFLTRELLRRCYDDSFSCNLSLNV